MSEVVITRRTVAGGSMVDAGRSVTVTADEAALLIALGKARLAVDRVEPVADEKPKKRGRPRKESD